MIVQNRQAGENVYPVSLADDINGHLYGDYYNQMALSVASVSSPFVFGGANNVTGFFTVPNGVSSLLVTGRSIGNTDYVLALAFSNDGTILRSYEKQKGDNYEEFKIELPDGTKYVAVCSNTSNGPFPRAKTLAKTPEELRNIEDVNSSIRFYQGGLDNLTGKPSNPSDGNLFNNVVRSGDIRVGYNGITIIADKGHSFIAFEYDLEYNFLGVRMIPGNYLYFNRGEKRIVRLNIYGNSWGAYKGNTYVPDSGIRYLTADEAKNAGIRIFEGEVSNQNEKDYPLVKTIFNDVDLASGLTRTQTLSQRESVFQDAIDVLDSLGYYDIQKVSLGKDQSGTYDMFGYVITPPNYTTTAAISAHFHADENTTPLSVVVLLRLLAQEKLEPNLSWIKANVRFVIMWMCNPWGYNKWASQGYGSFNYRGRYNSRNVNLCRNFDYNWAWQTSEVANRGDAPSSEAEVQHFVNFFGQYADSIDFHLDLHDFNSNAFPDSAFQIATNLIYSVQPEVAQTLLWLEEKYNVERTALAPYGFTDSNASNYMLCVLGIPSVATEHSMMYWPTRSYSEAEDILVAFNEFFNYFVAIANATRIKGGPFYAKKETVAYRNTELALKSWTNSDIIARADALGWTKASETYGGYSYKSSASSGTARKNIMVCCGADDDNNGALTVLRFMSELDDNLDKFAYLKRMKDIADIYVLPIPLNNMSIITDLVGKYSIDEVIYVDGDCLVGNNPKVYLRSADINDFIRYNLDYELDSETELPSGVSGYIVKLNDVIEESQRFGNVVAGWFGYVMNIAASLCLD